MPFIVTWLLSLILFISVPIKNIPDNVEPYYNEYVSIVKNECPKITVPRQLIIEFKELKNEQIGLCYLYAFRRRIQFDPFYWTSTNDMMRKQLVFHELTHCILETHHDDSYVNYMNSYIIYIPEETLIEQVKQNARSYCN
jgi:hypothetical protein